MGSTRYRGWPTLSARSANDRLKAAWARRVRRGLAAAVVLHAAALAVTRWDVNRLVVDLPPVESRALVLMPTTTALEATGGTPIPTVPLPLRSEPVDAPPDLDSGVGDVPGMGDVWDALSSRLRGRTDLVPRMAERVLEAEPPPTKTDEAADSAGDPDILAHAAPVDLSSLGADSLALARLEELQPELALFAPSVWILIRNHNQVENFLRASYLLDPEPEGSVAVMVWIDRRGSVEWAEITRSSGRPDLDEYALELFNEVARFRPARERGMPVSMSANFALQFPF